MDASYALGWKSSTPQCGSRFNLPGANALTITCNLGGGHIGMHARLRTVGSGTSDITASRTEIVAVWNDASGTFNVNALQEDSANQMQPGQLA